MHSKHGLPDITCNYLLFFPLFFFLSPSCPCSVILSFSTLLLLSICLSPLSLVRLFSISSPHSLFFLCHDFLFLASFQLLHLSFSLSYLLSPSPISYLLSPILSSICYFFPSPVSCLSLISSISYLLLPLLSPISLSYILLE